MGSHNTWKWSDSIARAIGGFWLSNVSWPDYQRHIAAWWWDPLGFGLWMHPSVILWPSLFSGSRSRGGVLNLAGSISKASAHLASGWVWPTVTLVGRVGKGRTGLHLPVCPRTLLWQQLSLLCISSFTWIGASGVQLLSNELVPRSQEHDLPFFISPWCGRGEEALALLHLWAEASLSCLASQLLLHLTHVQC